MAQGGKDVLVRNRSHRGPANAGHARHGRRGGRGCAGVEETLMEIAIGFALAVVLYWLLTDTD